MTLHQTFLPPLACGALNFPVRMKLFCWNGKFPAKTDHGGRAAVRPLEPCELHYCNIAAFVMCIFFFVSFHSSCVHSLSKSLHSEAGSAQSSGGACMWRNAVIRVNTDLRGEKLFHPKPSFWVMLTCTHVVCGLAGHKGRSQYK